MKVYMDNGATTKIDPRVLEEMMPFLKEKYGNPSSIHTVGQEAKIALEESREKIAKTINAEPEEIIFTSGGTESDNMAILGTYKTSVITSAIEHPAVINVCKTLNHKIIKVNQDGIVDLKSLEKEIEKDSLVTIMFANNEIGIIQPVKEISKIVKKKGAIFHTDAVQAFGKIPIDVKELGIDLMSLSSHKIYGPKGVGTLYVRKGIKIKPLFKGGGQEDKLRSGTENVAGIVGFAKAAELAVEEMKEDNIRLIKMRDKLIKGLLSIPNTRLNGHASNRLSNNINISFDFIEGEGLVLHLDSKDIYCSTGSACSSNKLEPSHVLTALGLSAEQAHGSLRLTLGRFNKMEEVDYVLENVKPVVEKLRKISPLK